MKIVKVAAIVLFALFTQMINAQDYLTEDQSCIANYQAITDSLLAIGQTELAMSYMVDSTVANCMIGKKVPSSQFLTYQGEQIYTDSLSAFIMLFSASWCQPCVANISAVNKFAQEYGDSVTIMVVYWDTQEKMGEIAGKYADKILLIPSPEKQTVPNGMVIDNFHHHLGFPASYAIDRNKYIVELTIGATVPGTEDEFGKIRTEEEALASNFKRLVTLFDAVKLVKRN